MKKIYNDYNQEIGLIVRCSSITRIETYMAKIESLKELIKKTNNNVNANTNVNNNNINFNSDFNNAKNMKGNFNNNASNPSNMNVFNFNQNNINSNQNHKKVLKPCTSIGRKFYAKTNPDILIYASMSFFFQIDELKNFLFPDENIDFMNFKNFILTKVDPKIKTFQTYDKIFEEILAKLDPDNQINKDYIANQNNIVKKKDLKNLWKNLIIKILFKNYF